MAPGQRDRSLFHKQAEITQSHNRRGYRHQEPSSGRPLYSVTDHELSILRDWQLGSYGSDGIGRQRTLGPSYMGSSNWKQSMKKHKPPPDFSEIPHRRRGMNKPMHGSVDAAREKQRVDSSRPAAGDLLVDSRPLRECQFLLEQEEAPRTEAPRKFFDAMWMERNSVNLTGGDDGNRSVPAKVENGDRNLASEGSGKIMLTGKDRWLDGSSKETLAWR